MEFEKLLALSKKRIPAVKRLVTTTTSIFDLFYSILKKSLQ